MWYIYQRSIEYTSLSYSVWAFGGDIFFGTTEHYSRYCVDDEKELLGAILELCTEYYHKHKEENNW